MKMRKGFVLGLLILAMTVMVSGTVSAFVLNDEASVETSKYDFSEGTVQTQITDSDIQYDQSTYDIMEGDNTAYLFNAGKTNTGCEYNGETTTQFDMRYEDGGNVEYFCVYLPHDEMIYNMSVLDYGYPTYVEMEIIDSRSTAGEFVLEANSYYDFSEGTVQWTDSDMRYFVYSSMNNIRSGENTAVYFFNVGTSNTGCEYNGETTTSFSMDSQIENFCVYLPHDEMIYNMSILDYSVDDYVKMKIIDSQSTVATTNPSCDSSLSTLPCEINGSYFYKEGNVYVSYNNVVETIETNPFTVTDGVPASVSIDSGTVLDGYTAEIMFTLVADNMVPMKDGHLCSYNDCQNFDNNDDRIIYNIISPGTYSFRGNEEPDFFNPEPSDGEVIESLPNGEVSLDAADSYGYNQNNGVTFRFYDASDDSIIGMDGTPFGSLYRIDSNEWNINEFGEYSWYVVADDGLETVTSPTYSFTYGSYCDNSLLSVPCMIDGPYNYRSAKVNVSFPTLSFTLSDNPIQHGDDWVYVDSASPLNTGATIDFEVDDPNLIPYRDGEPCTSTYCTNINNDGSGLSFDVSGFSNYSVSGPPHLENETLIGQCEATDIDTSQSIKYIYDWYKDGTHAYDGNYVPSQLTTAGEQWTLQCTANDSITTSDALNSTAVTITDTSTVPEVEYVNFTGEAGSLVGRCKANDDEGDLLNYSFRWYRNGVLNVTYSNDSITSNEEIVNTHTPPSDDAGNDWIFSCQAEDLDGSTGFVNSTEKTIPSITFANFNVEEATDTSIEVAWTTDADETQLYINDTLERTTNLKRYTFEDLEHNTTYTIRLVPIKDGFFGMEYEYNVSTIPTDNPSPVMKETIITPSNAYTDIALTGSCRADDVNNIRLFYTYTWRVNDVVVDSGVTGYEDRDETKIIGSLTGSNYEFNDTVSLTCQAEDGVTSSAGLQETVTIKNREPVISNHFVVTDGSDFRCDYDYSDEDGHTERTPSYDWYKNNASLGVNSSTIAQSQFDTGDNIKCEVTTGDPYTVDSYNSSIYVYGDIEKPQVTIETIPSSVYSTSSYEIRATCTDNTYVADGYPVVRFVNPNYIEEELEMYYDGDDEYFRYNTFGIVGEYTDFEVECRDGNGNRRVVEYDGTLYSKDRETTVNIGGGGGDDVTEPFRNITSFDVEPLNINYILEPGGSTLDDIEVRNTDIVDISFTMAVIRSPETPETYEWVDIEDERKSFTFDIAASGGLQANNRFIPYRIDVPDDAPEGEYEALIEVVGIVAGEERSITTTIDIEVQEGGQLFAFLGEEVFTLPSTQNLITGQVTGIPEGEGTIVTVGTLLLIFGGIGGILFIRRWALRRM